MFVGVVRPRNMSVWGTQSNRRAWSQIMAVFNGTHSANGFADLPVLHPANSG